MGTALATFALLAVAGIAPATAGPAPHVWTYPAPGDCPIGTLQDCINLAAPGDTIQIATDNAIVERVVIQKSLTLRAASGFHPTISLGAAVYAPGTTVYIVIRDITFRRWVDVAFESGSDHSVILRNVTVIDSSTSSGPGIVLATSVPAAFQVIGSRIDVNGNQDEQIALYASQASGYVTFGIIGNRLKGAGSSNGGSGISVQLQGAGTTRADIYNNAIWDSAGCNCGGSSGITIYTQDTARADVNIVGNTVYRVHGHAINVRNDITAGGQLAIDLFNNSITQAEDSAVYLGDSSSGPITYRAGYNNFFGNGRANELLGHSNGVANLHEPAGYVNAGAADFRLKSTSPLIDKGQVCSPGGIANPDAAAKSRLAGKTVDMGAYERGAGAPGRALVGGDGAEVLTAGPGNDILCGYGGPDQLYADAGNDYLDGGTGSDFLHLGPGADRAFGGGGKDTFCAKDGVHGNDTVNGGTNTDGARVDSGDTKVSIEGTANCTL